VVNGKSFVYRDGWWQEETRLDEGLVGPPAPAVSPVGD
jgi:hypothetical protein